LIKMPPASNGNPPYKGRSEELTTNIADFCNKIYQERTSRFAARHYYNFKARERLRAPSA
jgi:hypothetical protein